jgi:hypothetical protein
VGPRSVPIAVIARYRKEKAFTSDGADQKRSLTTEYSYKQPAIETEAHGTG